MNEEIQRDELELDVVFVGAGPSGLAGAIHLADLVAAHNEQVEKSGEGRKLEPAIAVIEKSAEIGAHMLSGAVMDPRGLDALIPDWRDRDCPVESPVTDDSMHYLTAGGSLKAPLTPPPLQNHGNFVVSLYRLARWLGEEAEKRGVDVFPGFPAVAVLTDGPQIVGVRTGDKGIDKHGNRKSNFEPGVDIKAKVTVFGEGTRGNLVKQLTLDRGLAGVNPQTYGTGVKEVWQVPEGRIAPGAVYHTLGHPLDASTYGGGWIYGMADNKVSVGFVVGLDYRNPTTDPHHEFQRYKAHPFVRSILEGGRCWPTEPRPCPWGAGSPCPSGCSPAR